MRNPNLSSQWLTALVGVFYILAPPLRLIATFLARRFSMASSTARLTIIPGQLGKILGFKLEVSVSSHASRRLPRNDP